tara:strand:- start:5287 stop:5544 length:258 start_codon:yes stop_codon:yes gene_type:complete
MKISYLFLSILSLVYSKETCKDIIKQENCVSFSVGQGTGCSWMCEYCQNELGTSNYYFTDGVCTYEEGGCTGSPQVGVTYTCCSN